MEALDLLGRAHTLQAQVIEPGDQRAVQDRKEMTLTLTQAAREWFASVEGNIRGGRQDGMTLMIVSLAFLLSSSLLIS